MGKFINTNYNDTIDGLIDSMKSIINNPYYKWSDQPPTKVTYYNISKEASTLDEGSKIEYSDIGSNSPIKYNKITDFIVYGLENISINLNNEDFGVESDSIEGEAIILPGTITPYPGDYFSINYLEEKKILFRINQISPDTLENGANLYKVGYKLESTDGLDNIEMNLNDEYTMLVNNVGTSFNSIIRKESYNFIEVVDNITVALKKYFKAIFYNSRVQTFTFKFLENYFYDPYMIEFMINNKVLEGDDEYIYIGHQTKINAMFSVNYTYTFFRCVELRDIKKIHKYKLKAIGTYINDRMSIFDSRPESYYEIAYDSYVPQFNNIISTFDCDLLTHIEECKYYDEDDKKIYNIIIKYFNDIDISEEDLDNLEFLEYRNNTFLFYSLPIIIYCLEQYVIRSIKK